MRTLTDLLRSHSSKMELIDFCCDKAVDQGDNNASLKRYAYIYITVAGPRVLASSI